MGLIPRRLKRGLLMRAVLWGTKGIAKGKFGPVPQKVWRFFEGAKTYTGLVFLVVGYGFGAAFNLGLCPDCPAWDKGLMAIGAVLVQVGLLDAANREPGPNDLQEASNVFGAQARLQEAKRKEREGH